MLEAGPILHPDPADTRRPRYFRGRATRFRPRTRSSSPPPMRLLAPADADYTDSDSEGSEAADLAYYSDEGEVGGEDSEEEEEEL